MSLMPNSDKPILLFDCDPGCDDALALALMAQRQSSKRSYSEVNILTVAGNVSVEQTTFNAARVLTASLLDQIPSKGGASGDNYELVDCFKVFRGCSQNTDGEKPSAASVHGRDGLGDAPNCLIWEEIGHSPEQREPGRESFHELLKRLIDDRTSAVERYRAFGCEDELTSFDLLCTGPLTNLAFALVQMPKNEQAAFWRKCRNIVIMGGAFGLGGNITHSAEFNIFADPTATDIVLTSFGEFKMRQQMEAKNTDVADPYLHFVSLDITEEVAIPIDSKGTKSPTRRVAKFLRYALKQYGQFHVFHCKRPVIRDGNGDVLDLGEFDSTSYANAQLAGSNGDGALNRYCYLHDPLAAWVLLEGMVTDSIWTKSEIRIDTGQGHGQGRIILSEPRAKGGMTPVPIASHGLIVKWLDPAKFSDELKRRFIDDVASLLEIEIAQSWKRENQKLPLT